MKGSEIEGLSAGTYYVRVKANGRALASPIQAVTIAEYREEHVCAGAGEWHSDGTYHWKLCICGAKVEEGVHVGGIASCTEKAECEICQEAYGETGEHSLGIGSKSVRRIAAMKEHLDIITVVFAVRILTKRRERLIL